MTEQLDNLRAAANIATTILTKVHPVAGLMAYQASWPASLANLMEDIANNNLSDAEMSIVGLDTTTPISSAVLDLTARTLGLLATGGIAAGAATAGSAAAVAALVAAAAALANPAVRDLLTDPEFWETFKHLLDDPLGLLDALKDLLNQSEASASPIVLDLDGDGVETLSLASNIHFDHDSNGFAELSGWVGSDDGLLALDKNGNGIIDNGTELFGNNTLLANGTKAANGFLALAELNSNGDGVINEADTAWANLRVWRDMDQDGVSDTGELITLSEAGVAALNLNYSASTTVDASGNAHKQVGSFVRSDGTTGTATDVWFAADLARTLEVEILEVSPEIAALPDLTGFGNVHSLHQAMARDASGDLQALVEAFVSETDRAARDALLDQLIYTWVGAEDVPPTSRGSYVDARQLATIEAFLGEYYKDSPTSKPHHGGGPDLTAAFETLKTSFKNMLLAQSHLQPFLDEIELSFDPASSSLKFSFQAVVDLLVASNDTDPNYIAGLTQDFAGLIYHRSLASIDQVAEFLYDIHELSSIVLPAKLPSGQNYILGVAEDETINGTSGSELIYGGAGNDLLYGNDGSDNVVGGIGNDTLYGGDSSDTLTGGAGNDFLYGGFGNDIYLFNLGDGQDSIKEGTSHTAEVDRLRFGEGIAPTDITLAREGYHLLLIHANGVDKITVQDWFSDTTKSVRHIEWIEFTDGTAWSKSTITTQLLHQEGDESDNVLNGVVTSGYINVLIGNGGNDTLNGGDAGDQLDGGAGNDLLYGNDGGDNAVGGIGNDTVYGGDSSDTLTGGTGNDFLYGGFGNDIYLFNLGDGQDSIKEGTSHTAEVDRLRFGEGIAPTDITLAREGYHLLLIHANGVDKITVEDWFSDTTKSVRHIEWIEFTDGTAWSKTALTTQLLHQEGDESDNVLNGVVTSGYINVLIGNGGNDTLNGGNAGDQLDGGSGNDLLYGDDGSDNLTGGDGNDTLYGDDGSDNLLGGNGNDTLYGGYGNDTVISGTGNDVLYGGYNNDLYLFSRGDGQDTIQEPSSSGGTDVLQFLENIEADQLWFTRTGNNLNISVIGTEDSVNIVNWYSNTSYKVDQFKTADGGILLYGQVETLVSAMSAYATLPLGQTTLTEDYQSGLASIIAASWQLA